MTPGRREPPGARPGPAAWPAAPRRTGRPPRRRRTPDRWPCRGLALADGLAGGQGLDVRGIQRVAGDAPVAALHLLDDYPGDRAHVLRSPPWCRSASAPCP